MKYQVEYGDGYFNWEAEQVADILRQLGIRVAWDAEFDVYSDFEISKDEWEKLGEKIAEYSGDDEAPVLKNRTADDLITWRQLKVWYDNVNESYDKSNGFVRLGWF